MPEERGLYPKVKVGDQLSYFARLSGYSFASAPRTPCLCGNHIDQRPEDDAFFLDVRLTFQAHPEALHYGTAADVRGICDRNHPRQAELSNA